MLTTFKASAKKTATGLQVETQARNFTLTIDEPEALGGTDTGMNPVEAVLCALGACQAIVCAAFAASQDFSYEEFWMDVEGDLDPDGFMGLDIGPKTVELFKKELAGAKTVFWNGPMGVFEDPRFAKGTIEVCETLANLDGATTIIGGGDSASAAKNLGFAEKFSHISTGGGASLEYMEGKELPGIAIIPEK
jgi:phosphoglycerate kinase